MKLNFKRLMAMLLSVMMVVGMLPTAVFATETDGTEPASESTVVASVNGTDYASFSDAVANWTSGTTLTLKADVTWTDPLLIQGGKNVTLDLNGKTFTGMIGVMVESADVISTLTVKDSATGGTINGGVMVTGVLNLESGTITGSGFSIYNATVACWPSSWDYPVVNVTGGTINYTGTEGAAIYGVANNGRVSDLTIGGSAVITSTAACVKQENAYASGGKTDVSGGTFTAGTGFDIIVTETDNTTVVTGGSFNNDSVKAYVAENASVTINGESYTNAPATSTGSLGVMYIDQTESGRARVYGEASNIYATASVVVKLYCNGILVGTTSLKGVEFPYESNALTINMVMAGEPSDSWDTVWETSAPSAHAIPDTAELVVDGQVMATVDVKLNGPDGVKKVVAAVTDDNGMITKFISNSDFSSDFTAALNTAFAEGGNIVLLRDITVDTGTITIPDGVSVNFDMNGHKITVTDNATTNYELFYIYGEMTVTGNGTIELTSTNDRDWNAMSAIFHNRGGVLTIENGTYTNLGGTDMAWVVDNSGNYYGDATTNIKGGTLTSTYTAIRNRMEQNSHGASGTAILNISGGSIDGTTSAVWAQAASESTTAPATGEINVTGGTVGLINTARSAGAECMTTISGGTVAGFKGEVGELTVTSTGTAPASITLLTAAGEEVDYIVDENGKYVEAPAAPAGPTEVTTYEELLAALETDNANIIMMNDITATATQSSGYGKAGIVLDAGDVLDGNGKTLTINGANSTWDCAIAMRGGEVKNLTIAGAMRGVFMPGANGDVVIDSCVFKDVIYTFNSDAGSKDYTVTVKNTTLNGWTSFSDVHKSVTFDTCSFGKGSGYEFCRPYQSTTFTNCTFDDGYELDTSETADDSLVFNNCTYAGEALTASNDDMFYNGGTVVIDGVSTDVTPPKGNVPYAYTSQTTIWGETWTNSKESYVIKVVDTDGNVMGTTTLNPELGLCDGDVTVTWHITLPGIADNDSAWIQEWTTAPSLTVAPAKVELWADGVKVNEGNIQLNGPDNLNKIYAAVADTDGNILSYYTSVSAAGAAATSGQTVQLLRDTTETVELAAGVKLDKNGYTADGVTVATPTYIAQIGDDKYESIQAAIEAAGESGDTIVLLSDIMLTEADRVADAPHNVLLYVAGKDITLDMNGKTISVVHEDAFATGYIVSVICVADGAGLTVTGEGIIDVNANDDTPDIAYIFFNQGSTGHLTIQNGTFHMDNSADSIVYSHKSKNTTISGGTFSIDKIGTASNGFPCIFSVQGQNEGCIYVTGGTYNANVFDQYWRHEVQCGGKYAARDNGDGTWTVVPAVAYVTVNVSGHGYQVGYENINEAIAAADNGETVTLVADITLAETIKIEKEIALDLNGKTITGTDNNTTGNFYLINNVGTLTVKDSVGNGKITLTATTDRDWNSSSVVIATNPGGKLVVESGTIEHLGGTDMAYALDNLTNGDTTYAETVINGGTIKSTYRAVRQFLNGNGAQNILTITGGTIEGANKSIFFHGPTNKKPCSGTLTIGANAAITGDIYLFVTAGSTEWPVTVSIASAALQGGSTVQSVNVPAQYVVKETNGTWGVEANPSYGKVAAIGETYYESFAAALNEVQDDETITILNVEGSEVGTEIDFIKDIEFTITGNAPNYALPVVTFQNATVNIENATILIPELDARQNATINVIDSIVYDAGGNSIVKSYYNGAINISGTSVVYTMQVTTMGYITISDTAKLNATWQTNVYGNGMITVEEAAQFNTAALQLTGKEYSGRDNTDADRVGQPATIVVDGATFIVGSVKSSNGADYSYNSSSYGVNIGTIEGKSAVLDIKNGATVQILIKDGSAATVGTDGTVVVDGSTLNGVNLSGAGTTKFYNTVNFYGDNVVNTTNLGGSPFHLIVNKGATLNITRFVLGYDRAITVYGEIEDAHAFDPTDKTPSLKFNSNSGVSVGGTDTGNLTVTDAYIELGNSSWKNASGTYTWNFKNSYVSATSFTNNNAPGSESASWTVTFDDSVLAAKNYIKNGANTTYNFTNGSVATTGSMRIDGKFYIDETSSVTTTSYQNNKFGAQDEHGDITGVVEVDGTLTIGSNAALAVELRGGEVKIGENGKVDLTKCPLNIDADSKVIIDAAGMVAGDYANLVGTVENNGTIEVINNNSLTAEVQDGKIVLVKKADVAKIGEQGFTSFAEAIAAAQSGDTIVLLADITEDVTISKNLTIDGTNKNYTGTIYVDKSVNANVVVTVKNVNFVDGTYYAIKTDNIKSITVENCTVTNYASWGFLYANKSTTTVVVKNVQVDNATYGFHWVYGTSATLENVTMTNVAYGIMVQNYASKTITLKNCSITGTNPIYIWERDNKTGVQTFKFEGANTVGTLSTSQYTKYILTAADATLTAPEGSTVTTTVESSMVKYADGAYKVVKAVAKIGNDFYETVADALKAADDGATIELIYAEGDAPIAMNGYVSGKTVTITGTAQVDWEKGFLFVGRTNDGTAAADATLIFENATLTTTQGGDHGIHVSGAEKDSASKANGTVKMIDSTINLSYLINKGNMTLDNSTLTVKSGFSIGGRPAKETVSGEDATATISLTNVSKVVVNNHNGMGLGYEAIGVMNIDANSSFETTQSFLVTAKGTMNIAGTAAIAGTLTNNGSIVLTDAAATLTSSECGKVTTDVAGYEVTYANGKYALAEEVESAAIAAKSATLLYEDMIQIRYKFEVTGEDIAEYGMLVFSSESDAEAHDASKAIQKKELGKESDGFYYGYTDGIAAKEMGDSQFVVGYVKLSDGTYVYGETVEYSPRIYAQRMVNKDTTSEATKTLCKALMHYGAAAQLNFNYKTESLMNAGFDSVDYDASVLGNSIFSVDTTETNGFTTKAATLLFEGALTYRVKYAVNDTISDKTLYLEYTIKGETGSVQMTLADNGCYYGYIAGIAAKDMDEALKAKPYYLDDNGDKVYGAELTYSGYEYAGRTIANSSEEYSVNLAKAFAMYISAADAAISK